MSAPVDVVTVTQRIANVGEYRELREAMEKCLRPHEREGFAEALANMREVPVVLAALIGELDNAHKIIGIALNCLQGDAKRTFCADVIADGLDGDGITRANERAALLARCDGRLTVKQLAEGNQTADRA